MADHGISTAPTARDKYFFLLRRLHSLTGLIPVGVFVMFHLVANSTILATAPGEGGDKFQNIVNMIHKLNDFGLLVQVEVVGIFLPLLFHAVLGVMIILGSSPNASVYRYGPNVRFTLQRLTAWIALAFILFHVWQMHWFGKPFGGGAFDPHVASTSAAGIMQGHWLWAPLYLIGVLATVFHLANGIWTALITWGVTVGPRSQRMSGYACAVLGVGLGVIGLGALYGFRNYDATPAAAGVHAAEVASTTVSGH